MASSNPLILVDGSSPLPRLLCLAAGRSAHLDRLAERRRPCHGQHDAQPSQNGTPTATWPWCSTPKGKTFRDDIYPEYKATAPACRTICAARSPPSTR